MSGRTETAASRCECEWGDRDPLTCQAAGRCLSESAAYTPPVGMKSLERKLMHNGERGTGYFEPEWAEVRVVMRERETFRRALEQIAWQIGTDLPHARRLDRDEMQATARAALAGEEDE